VFEEKESQDMPERRADITVAHQVEFAIGQLESISLLPSVADKFLTELFLGGGNISTLAGLVESDPCLTAKMFSVVHSKGGVFSGVGFSAVEMLGKLSLGEIRKIFFSYEIDSCDASRSISKKDLILHSLAVAVSAKAISQAVSPRMDGGLAYLAGLLHNVGVLALYDSMPKSFDSIVAEAKLNGSKLAVVERKYLGVDHTIIGKRLGAKWNLPKQVSWAAWLYNKNTEIIAKSVPLARIAQIVSLGHAIARLGQVGDCGCYDEVVWPGELVESLGLGRGLVEQIIAELAGQVEAAGQKLGFDSADPRGGYLATLNKTAAKLTEQNIKLEDEQGQTGADSMLWNFAKDFVLRVDGEESVVEIAKEMAGRLQKFYHAGHVCLYLLPTDNSKIIDAVVAGDAKQGVRAVIVDMPESVPAVPAEMFREFGMSGAAGRCDWLFNQLDVEFDRDKTIVVPLVGCARAIGAVMLEQRYPVEREKLFDSLKVMTSIVAGILKEKIELYKQRVFSEQFAELVGGRGEVSALPGPLDLGKADEKGDDFAGLVEMAAGAGHELNNPLSVISGRAQLLMEGESDENKIGGLKKIQQNSEALSQIIVNLLSFAEPKSPKATKVEAGQIIEEAIQLVMMKKSVSESDFVVVNELEEGQAVFVDSGQIASAIANILHNAIEACGEELRPVEINVGGGESGDIVSIVITDHGCGMDSDTIAKATHPFFSGKKAGRQRGMGLANARRLIELNKGTLSFDSMVGQGTSVVVELPLG